MFSLYQLYLKQSKTITPNHLGYSIHQVLPVLIFTLCFVSPIHLFLLLWKSNYTLEDFLFHPYLWCTPWIMAGFWGKIQFSEWIYEKFHSTKFEQQLRDLKHGLHMIGAFLFYLFNSLDLHKLYCFDTLYTTFLCLFSIIIHYLMYILPNTKPIHRSNKIKYPILAISYLLAMVSHYFSVVGKVHLVLDTIGFVVRMLLARFYGTVLVDLWMLEGIGKKVGRIEGSGDRGATNSYAPLSYSLMVIHLGAVISRIVEF